MVAVISNDGHAHPVLLFDGICNLCNWAVEFTIARDAGGYIRFASLQSKTAQQLLSHYTPATEKGLAADFGARFNADLNAELMDDSPLNTFQSVVLLEGGEIYTESTAALRLLRYLRMPWPLFSVFQMIPRPARDAMYRFIAKHRYHWFGKREACMVPSPDVAIRFLDMEENTGTSAKSKG